MFKFLLAIYFSFLAMSGVRTEWQNGSLRVHNYYKRCHNVQSLVLTSELNDSAQRCANYLASIKKMDHVCNKIFGTRFGENLASGSGLGQNASSAGVRSTKLWYAEEPKHNYNSNDFQYNSGHFSQVIWKSTTQLGMGYAKNGNFVIVVGHYKPPGNYQGQFTQNVIRPKSKCQ